MDVIENSNPINGINDIVATSTAAPFGFGIVGAQYNPGNSNLLSLQVIIPRTNIKGDLHASIVDSNGNDIVPVVKTDILTVNVNNALLTVQGSLNGTPLNVQDILDRNGKEFYPLVDPKYGNNDQNVMSYSSERTYASERY